MLRILVTLLFLCSSLAKGETSSVLTFDLALSKAMEYSLQRRLSSNKTIQAGLQSEIGSHANDPRLSTQAGLAWQYKKAVVPADKNKEYQRTQTYGLTLNVPVYDFGRQSSKEETLDYAEKAAQSGEEETSEDVLWQTAKQYLAALTARNLEENAEKQLKVAQEKLKTLKNNYQMGLRPESDVVSAEVDLGKAEIDYKKAADDTKIALMKLLIAMGLDSNELGKFIITEKSGKLRPPPEMRALVFRWKVGNPSAAEKTREIEREGLSAELRGLASQKYPSLQTVLSGQEVGTLGPVNPQASAQLQLTWDIPWNGMYSDEKRLIAARKEALDIQDAQDKRTKLEQLKTGVFSLEAAEKHWQELSLQLDRVKKQRKLIAARYESGKAALLELSTSEASLISLETDKIKLSSEAMQAALTMAEALSVKDISQIWK